jgi:hypothetical protein
VATRQEIVDALKEYWQVPDDPAWKKASAGDVLAEKVAKVVGQKVPEDKIRRRTA